METEEMMTERRVVCFFEISSLVCSCCGELGHLSDGNRDIQIIRKPEYYGIITKSDWEKKMGEETEWVIKNKEEILSLLPKIETLTEWKLSCKALYSLIKLVEQKAKKA